MPPKPLPATAVLPLLHYFLQTHVWVQNERVNDKEHFFGDTISVAPATSVPILFEGRTDGKDRHPRRVVRPTLDGTLVFEAQDTASSLTYCTVRFISSSFGTVPANQHQELMGKRGRDYVLHDFCVFLF